MWAWLLPLQLVLGVWWRARREGVPPSAFYYLWSTLVVGAALALGTEVLSLARALTPWTVRILLLATTGLLLWRARPHVSGSRVLKLSGFSPPRWRDAVPWLLPGFVLLITGLLAWKSPPNTLDSFAYHLARVVHWTQNRDVAPYPTHIQRQIYQFPWAEEAILWLRLLAGHDGWAAFVQWWALASLFVVLPLLTRELMPRASFWGTLLAAATLPMAILQASSTQNDLVTAYWLVAFVYLLLRYRRTERTGDALLAATALGLALRTKATAYLWGFIPGLWLLALLLRRRAWRTLALALAWGGLLVLGPLARNLWVFGHPFGTATLRASYLSEMWGWKPLLSNLSRNVAVHFAVDTFLRQQDVYIRVERAVRRLHLWMDLDEAHPALTWNDQDFRLIPYRAPNEDTTGAPYHLFFLVLFALPWALSRKGLPGRYALLLVAMALFFSAALKWQRWIIRLQVPWFLLAMPVLGLWLHEAAAALRLSLARPAWRNLARAALLAPPALLAVAFFLREAWPALMYNDLRPFLGPASVWHTPRERLLWRAEPAWEQPFFQALEVLQEAGCQRIGLVMTEGGWEYPWWYALAPLYPDLRLEHVLVDNPTQAFASRLPSFHPCALIVSRPDTRPERWTVQGRVFHRAYRSQEVPLEIYLLAETP